MPRAQGADEELMLIMSTLEREFTQTRTPSSSSSRLTTHRPCHSAVQSSYVRSVASSLPGSSIGTPPTSTGAGMSRTSSTGTLGSGREAFCPSAAASTPYRDNFQRSQNGASSAPVPGQLRRPLRKLSSVTKQGHSPARIGLQARTQSQVNLGRCPWNAQGLVTTDRLSLGPRTVAAPMSQREAARDAAARDSLMLERAKLKEENTRLRLELVEIEKEAELTSQRVLDAKLDFDRRQEHARSLEEFLSMLEEQLQETKLKSAVLEKQLNLARAGASGGGIKQPPAVVLPQPFTARLARTLQQGTADTDTSSKRLHAGANELEEDPCGVSDSTDNGPSAEREAQPTDACNRILEHSAAATDDDKQLLERVELEDDPSRSSCLEHKSAATCLDDVTVSETGFLSKVASPKEVVTADSPSIGAESWDFIVQGQPDESNTAAYASKAINCFPADALDRLQQRAIAFACLRGRAASLTKRPRPNQDDLLLACSASGKDSQVALYGVFDGYGTDGQECSAFLRSRIPDKVFTDPELYADPQITLQRAFSSARKSLLRQPFDAITSGSSATVVLMLTSAGKATQLFVASVGHSHALLVSRNAAISDLPAEVEDLTEGASEVASPGKPITLSSATQVSARTVRAGRDLWLVLLSAGILEVASWEQVADVLVRHGASSDALEDLCRAERDQSEESGANDVVRSDHDATIIAVALPER
eukprot:TRINITY_DN30456_c0_g2_i4.p1 TRINITY_DN30456_c0_g2~~TRINITY_DN30456_c0_g2_i4.p1  ORF type:complete len:708 (+),score=74.82 TRINITY_DN30456_c0_g2_i4:117-2240(+)